MDIPGTEYYQLMDTLGTVYHQLRTMGEIPGTGYHQHMETPGTEHHLLMDTPGPWALPVYRNTRNKEHIRN
jgi:hypothetical protein